jgi:hypothetical protein
MWQERPWWSNPIFGQPIVMARRRLPASSSMTLEAVALSSSCLNSSSSSRIAGT